MSQFDRGTSSDLPTVCADPRCTTTQTCQREKHERYGNAPGVSYGPRCVPLPHPVKTACPTCEGKCCRDVYYGHRRTHMDTQDYTHACPDCEAGLAWEAYAEHAPHPVRTAEEERADVLAFIERALKYPFPSDGSAARPQSYIRMLHEMIASGDHLGAAKREKAE